jgi:NADH-quinone oxidoreductase subunit D
MPIRTEPVTINLGPQHPSTHGVFRLRVTFDGEVVLDVEPVFGYMHRGTEKLAEARSYVQMSL